MPVTAESKRHAKCGILHGLTVIRLISQSGLWLLLCTCSPLYGVQDIEKAETLGATTPAASQTETSDEDSTAKVNVPEKIWLDLLADDVSSNWKHFSSKDGTSLASVWKAVEVNGERQLICSGTPKGFLFTKKTYTNFELEFEWKYTSDPNGNSGVLIFTKNEPRLWPTSMQIQLHQPRAGCVFPSGDAKSDNSTEAKELALEVGKWNTCRVIAQGGKLSVEVNKKPAGDVSGCIPSMGSVALQSEGSETIFRRMRIRELSEIATPASATVVEEPAGKDSPKTDGPSPAANN